MRAMMRTAIVGALVLCCGDAVGTFVTPSAEPVARLVDNLTAATRERPNDASAWYSLGRAHSLAFSRGLDHVPLKWQGSTEVADDDGMPCEHSDMWQDPATGKLHWLGEDKKGQLGAEALRMHLAEGLKAFARTVRLDPENPLHHLSYGYLAARGAKGAGEYEFAPGVSDDLQVTDADRAKISPELERLNEPSKKAEAIKKLLASGPAAARLALDHVTELRHRQPVTDASSGLSEYLTRYWNSVAEHEYLRAYEKSFRGDLNRDLGTMGYQCLSSYEGGSKYIELVEARGATDAEQRKINEIKAILAKLAKKETTAITPIVLSMRSTTTVAELAAPQTHSRFDLDGTGRGTHWSWVKPDTGILVWDPEHEGKIDSGRRLFGNASWWIFFDNGYQALDALDDNRDGELAGAELDGIRVWFDRNSDGVCSPSEVVDLSTLGIVALSTRQTGVDGICPMNSRGMRLSDGRVLPTYDWIATSVPESEGLGGVRPVALSGVMSGMAIVGLVAGFGSMGARRRRGVSVAGERKNEAKTETHPNPSLREGLRMGECRDDE